MNLRHLSHSNEGDLALAASIMLEAADYRLQTYGHFPAAADGASLFSCFPAECAEEDRFLFAIIDHKTTVGLLQVARAYPAPEVAHIGLLLLRPQARRRHLGCQAVEQLAHKLRTWKQVKQMQLGVLISNPAAIRFWQHCGFTTTASGCHEPGLLSSGNVMVRTLKAKPLCKGGRCEISADHAHARHLAAVLR